MKDPVAAEGKKRLRHLESKFFLSKFILIIHLDELAHSKNQSIILARNDDGEQIVKQSSVTVVDHYRFQSILQMSEAELRKLPTFEKVVYLKAMIDKHTPAVT